MSLQIRNHEGKIIAVREVGKTAWAVVYKKPEKGEIGHILFDEHQHVLRLYVAGEEIHDLPVIKANEGKVCEAARLIAQYHRNEERRRRF